jgi:WD40 repeat protein
MAVALVSTTLGATSLLRQHRIESDADAEAEVEGTAAATEDFELAPIAAVELRPGSSTTVSIVLKRQGFDAAVRFAWRDLPDGIIAEPIASNDPGDRYSARLRADSGARLGTRTLTLVALGGDLRHEQKVRLTVLPQPVLKLTVEPREVVLQPGGAAREVKVTIDRYGCGDQLAKLTIPRKDLSPEVVVGPLEEKHSGEQTTIRFSIKATSRARPSKSTLALSGGIEKLSLAQSSAMTIQVGPPSVQLKADSGLYFHPGTRISLPITVDRGGYEGPCEVMVLDKDEQSGVTATVEQTPTETTLVFKVEWDATPRKGQLRLQAKVGGRLVGEPLAVTYQVAKRSFAGTLARHSGQVNAVAINPDGTLFASASQDKTIIVWDMASGAERIIRAQTKGVRSVAFSPDGQWLAYDGDGNTIRLSFINYWNQTTILKGHTKAVTWVAYRPDGKVLASGSLDGTIRLWDVATGKETALLKEDAGEVLAVAFSPDGSRIVSAGTDKKVRVWDAESHKVIRYLEGHSSRVNSVAYNRDGTLIVSGSNDKSIKIWDPETGRPVRTITGHAAPVMSVAFSADSQRIVSGSGDKVVKVWSTTTGNERATYAGHRGWVGSVTFSSDGQRIISASSDKTVKVWSTPTFANLLSFKVPPTGKRRASVAAVAFTPDRQRIITAGPGLVKLWDARSGKMPRNFDERGETQLAAISGDGTYIVGVLGKSGKVWDAVSGKELLSTPVLFPVKPDADNNGPGFKAFAQVQVTSLAISSDGTRVAFGTADNTVRVWDARTGKELLALKGHADMVSCLAISNDGNRIVSGSADKTLRVWDAQTGTILLTFTGHTGRIQSMAITGDGSRVVSTTWAQTKVWDGRTSKELLTRWERSSGGMTSLAISRDGRRVVSGEADGTVRVWDAITGADLLTFMGNSNWVSSVAISADGRRVLSAYTDGTVIGWDCESVP